MSRKFSFCTMSHPRKNRSITPHTETLEEIFARLEEDGRTRESKEGACFLSATFSEPWKRKNDLVDAVHWLCLDIDEGLENQADVDTLLGQFPFEGFAYSTWSDYADHQVKPSGKVVEIERRPHLRLMLPLSRSVSRAEYALLWLWAKKRSGDKLCRSTKDACRLFFTPRTQGEYSNTKPWIKWLNKGGKLLDPDTLDIDYGTGADAATSSDSVAVSPRCSVARPRGWTLKQVESLLKRYPASELEYFEWRDVGFALHHWYASRSDDTEAGYILFDAWSAQDVEGYDVQKNKAIWTAFSTERGAVITLATVEARASARAMRVAGQIATPVSSAKTAAYIKAMADGTLPNLRNDKGWTDSALGAAFAKRHKGDFVFISEFRDSWHKRQKDCWAPDTRGTAHLAAHQVACDVWDAGVALGLIRKNLVSTARGLMGVSSTEKILKAAQAQLTRPLTDFDNDVWALHVANGVIDLRTGELREHRSTDLNLKVSSVEYLPGAVDPKWNLLLETATLDDKEMQEFLQRSAGYSTLGKVTEDKFFFLYGKGGGGKGSFIQPIQQALGSYCWTANFSAFLKSRSEKVRSDIAHFKGNRWVVSTEMEEGARMDASLVKSLTGGDVVTTRHLYGTEFRFKPTFAIWWQANDCPHANSIDSGLWRRMLRVPFDNPLPEEKRDPNFRKYLTDNEGAQQAILAWLVEGCLMWQRDGLKVPDRVRMSTEDYQKDENSLEDFADTCLAFGDDYTEHGVVIQAVYARWCKMQGSKPMSAQALGKRLRHVYDCTKAPNAIHLNGRKGKAWHGVKVTTTLGWDNDNDMYQLRGSALDFDVGGPADDEVPNLPGDETKPTKH